MRSRTANKMFELLSVPEVLLWPLLASFVLAGIHVYFGIHVIARNVIFVDLALAQIAALGAIVGVFFGYETGHDNTAIYLYALAFTFIGALIFTISRSKSQIIPQEAVIGICYTVAFAGTLILLSKSALGPHELDKILKGDILWVQQEKVISTAAIYAAIGFLHLILRKQFLDLSISYTSEEKFTKKHFVYDFLFYMSFGFVVASSVTLVGVFLVFSLLVIPSVASMLIFPDIKRRLIFGWIFSIFICYLGMKLSWHYALPSSPLIVILFGSALVLAAFVKQLTTAVSKPKFLMRSTAVVAVLLLTIGVLYNFKKEKQDHHHEVEHLLKHGNTQERIYAITTLEKEEKIDEECMVEINKLFDSTESQIQIALCNLMKKVNSERWEQIVNRMIPKIEREVLSCYLELIHKKNFVSSKHVLMEKLKAVPDFDLKIEIFSVVLDLHEESSVEYILSVYKDFPAVLRGDLLDILNEHYHQKILTIEEFSKWWKK